MICPYCEKKMIFSDAVYNEKRKTRKLKMINRYTYMCKCCGFEAKAEENFTLKISDIEKLHQAGIEGCRLDNYLHDYDTLK